MVKVKLSLKARKDIEIVKGFISRDNPTRAESFSEELLAHSYEIISTFPLSSPLYNKPKNIRRLVYKKYNIYYRFNSATQTADILHILNSALLLNMTLKRL